MKYRGVKLEGWITSDFPIKDIDTEQFLDEFIAFIESKNYQFCGTALRYDYEGVKNDCKCGSKDC